MDKMSYIGKMLVFCGLIITFLGLAVLTFSKIKITFLGRLPGDIIIHKKNFFFYFPLATSIIVSLLLSFIIYIVYLFRK